MSSNQPAYITPYVVGYVVWSRDFTHFASAIFVIVVVVWRRQNDGCRLHYR